MVNFHLVPHADFKEKLVQQDCVEENIFVTGIPVHPAFTRPVHRNIPKGKKVTFLITGGHLGVGDIQNLLHKIPLNGSANYYVLCGRNKQLFHMIRSLHHQNIIPLSYIESRQKMNELYEQAHGIITKPGGLTISECLYKRIPIFIYYALPGQEEMNLQFLKAKGLAFHLEKWKSDRSIEKQIFDEFLFSQSNMNQYEQCIDNYHNQITKDHITMFINRILSI